MVTIPNIHSIGAVYEQLDPEGHETETGGAANVASRFGCKRVRRPCARAAARAYRRIAIEVWHGARAGVWGPQVGATLICSIGLRGPRL